MRLCIPVTHHFGPGNELILTGSISSFSFWVAFLSDRPCVLYAPAFERRLVEKAARPRDLVLGGCISGVAQ